MSVWQAIEKGRRGIFAGDRADNTTVISMFVYVGHTSFKQLTFMLLPALVAAFGIAIVATQHTRQTGVLQWNLHVGLHSPLHVWQLMALMSTGVCLVTLNLSVSDIFNTGCIDPLIRTTIAAVEADCTFQWLWVFLVLLGNVAFGTVHWNLEQNCKQDAARSTQRWLRILTHQVDGVAMQDRAIAAWRNNSLPSRKRVEGPGRLILSWLLKIPVIFLSMLPACAYVSGQVLQEQKTKF